MTKKLAKLVKVNDSLTIYRYDNGWMVEVSGRDDDNEYKTTKILCATEDDLISAVKEYNGMKLDD